jgi:hypothetical protein
MTLGRRVAAGQERRPQLASSPAGTPAGPPLSRSYANNVSNGSDQQVYRGRRRRRDRLRELLNRVSTLDRCHNCGWAKAHDQRSKDQGGPQMAQRDGVAYWRGVQTCGSIWCCPVCGAKIRHGRSVEISDFTGEWIRRGGEVYMVTLTSPHDLGMALGLLMVLISNAFRAVISGGAWVKLRDQLRIAGTIRALEVTHGLNGWHPHLHVLVYCWEPLDAYGVAAFELHFRRRWQRFVTKAGYRLPSDQHGVKVERCYSGAGAAEYIVKLQETGKNPGNEMARADMKSARGGHRLPFQILASAGDGDAADVKLWHEYEKATFRKQCITWSPVLRKLQKEWLDIDEQTDEELAAEDVNGTTVMYVTTDAMRALSRTPGLRVTLLEAWEDAGLDGLDAMAWAHGFMLAPGQVPVLRRKSQHGGNLGGGP